MLLESMGHKDKEHHKTSPFCLIRLEFSQACRQDKEKRMHVGKNRPYSNGMGSSPKHKMQ
jgi:homoserine kinase